MLTVAIGGFVYLTLWLWSAKPNTQTYRPPHTYLWSSWWPCLFALLPSFHSHKFPASLHLAHGTTASFLVPSALLTSILSPSLKLFSHYNSSNWDRFRKLLASHTWYDWLFISDLCLPVPDFFDIVLQCMRHFTPWFSKLGKSESFEWPNRACIRDVSQKFSVFRRRRRSLILISQPCFVPVKKNCSSTTQKAEETSVYCKAERLVSSFANSQIFLSI